MAARAQRDPRRAPMSIYEVHLGLVAARRRQPLAHLRRARRHAGALRRRHGLHASRAAAGQRASARRLVGLPADRALRADRAASASPPASRASSTAATRAGLGVILDWVPGALPDRPARPRALRRHRALRARRPAPGLPPGLEHRDLQLRPPRGRQLPRRQRAVLARPLPRRRPARRCRRLDALPRLLAQGRRVGAEPLRRQREPRGDRVPAPPQRRPVYARAPRRRHHRRGIDRLARRLAADVRRRTRLRLQVEHGVDERHARVHARETRSTAAGTTTG